MAQTAAEVGTTGSGGESAGHAIWVRVCHWAGAVGFVLLAVSGFFILMVHPRLYWGEVGNDLTPAILELPISNNHRPEEWVQAETFSAVSDTAVSSNRTYRIFNMNGWARSLHFLAAWLLVASGVIYLLTGIASGHFWRNVLPQRKDFSPRTIWHDIRLHLRFKPGSAGAGSPYGTLQRIAYAGVVFFALPLMLATGFAMSPAITAGFPFLSDLFGGHQSARTIHFFGFAALILFLGVHLTMVVLTGFRRQLRAMIMGK